ncbi:hypothetical protein LWP59_01365 [Amycolatopsis acidiphila]|uniref:PPE domain-containing protein n=1 Tax=Amycolatopsis acidiphila TaxID=715473 RepID=A0A558AMX9_9PSEU|nr:hypothetical protein [Amycolatopsis acidiphila]TVT25622.1 hypothetical protein FNH06_02110 [Amycolatopsis acidiphila]UIJ60377.1 hypothetical protein LWP59_01365 [Amycolatopsis acidiphila]
MTSTETENPLVAESEPSSGLLTNTGKDGASAIDNLPAQTAGSGLFNDVATSVKDFSDGDWANAAMDVATDGLDLLGAAMDPLGTLASAGVGFLIEHISFLKDGLDKLAGNPEAVTAKAQTWQNVSKQLSETAETYEKSAGKAGESYKGGDGANAYQATAKSYADSLRGAAGHAQNASTAMQVGAAIVGTERGLIRDMISEFVGGLIVKGLAALATSWCSFGGTIAAFIADTVVEGGILAEKISTRIAKIVEKLESLAKNANKSKAAIEAAAKALGKIGKAADRIVDKSVDAATKIESTANNLKQAGKEAKEAAEARKTAQELKEAGEGEKAGEKSFLDLGKWTEGEGVPKWNNADTVATVVEGRRQENEQGDRSKEAAEPYEEEHGEGKSGGE